MDVGLGLGMDIAGLVERLSVSRYTCHLISLVRRVMNPPKSFLVSGSDSRPNHRSTA